MQELWSRGVVSKQTHSYTTNCLCSDYVKLNTTRPNQLVVHDFAHLLKCPFLMFIYSRLNQSSVCFSCKKLTTCPNYRNVSTNWRVRERVQLQWPGTTSTLTRKTQMTLLHACISCKQLPFKIPVISPIIFKPLIF